MAKKNVKIKVDPLANFEKEIEEEYGKLAVSSFKFIPIPENPTPAELTTEMCRISGQYAFWSAVYVSKQKELSDIQNELDFFISSKYEESRISILEEREGKSSAVTESAIKNYMLVNFSYYKEKLMIINILKYKVEFLKKICKSWELKSVMLPTMCKLMDAEIRSTRVVVNKENELFVENSGVIEENNSDNCPF